MGSKLQQLYFRNIDKSIIPSGLLYTNAEHTSLNLYTIIKAYVFYSA